MANSRKAIHGVYVSTTQYATFFSPSSSFPRQTIHVVLFQRRFHQAASSFAARWSDLLVHLSSPQDRTALVV
ncbi:hypothetical protein KY285_016538 [Solanum tuberosum]|nr:hypothetical protein KY284_016550 [Solanum tuberosum]KAH0702260.1 hypothetical protein KY285_016538 [Solanum tuberosum]